MVCIGGISSRCNAGTGVNCVFRTLDSDLYMPNVFAVVRVEGGFYIDWDYNQYPIMDLLLLSRVKNTTPFITPGIRVKRSVGTITVLDLPENAEYELYVRNEAGEGYSPWERWEVPLPTTLGSVTGAEISTLTESWETYPKLSGVITVIGGIGQISKNNDGNWGDSVNMLPDDFYQVRVESSDLYSEPVQVEVDLPDVFTVTTKEQSNGWTPPGGEEGWTPPGGEEGWTPPGS